MNITNKNATLRKNDLLSLLRKYEEQDFYVGDNIPEKKLKNATKAYMQNRKEKVLGLLDSTVFGSSTDGIAITINGIYISSHPKTLIPNTLVKWKDISRAIFKGKDTRTLILKTYNKEISLNHYGNIDIKIIVKMINEILGKLVYNTDTNKNNMNSKEYFNLLKNYINNYFFDNFIKNLNNLDSKKYSKIYGDYIAVVYFLKEEYDKVIKFRDSKDAKFMLLKALSYMKMNDNENSLKYFQKTLEVLKNGYEEKESIELQQFIFNISKDVVKKTTKQSTQKQNIKKEPIIKPKSKTIETKKTTKQPIQKQVIKKETPKLNKEDLTVEIIDNKVIVRYENEIWDENRGLNLNTIDSNLLKLPELLEEITNLSKIEVNFKGEEKYFKIFKKYSNKYAKENNIKFVFKKIRG